MLTYIDGQATTGVVAVARPQGDVVVVPVLGSFEPRGAHMAVRTQAFQVKTTAPSPVLGDQLSSPPV